MKCVLCDNDTVLVSGKHLRATYYKCCNCSFIFKDKSDYVSPVEEKKRYDLHNNSCDSYKSFFDELIKTLANYVKNGRGLDFGSGPFPALYNILKNNYNMHKFDLYYDNNDEYLDYKYDFIVCTEVIEHIANPLKTLIHLKSLLVAKGQIFIMTELSDNKMFENWWYHRDVTHISFFSLETFHKVAKRIGMSVIYTNNKNIVVLGCEHYDS